MAESGEAVTKQRSLLNPEDNPVNYANAMNVQRLLDESSQFTRNAENALTWITNEDNEMQRAVDIMSQAKNQYAIAGMNDSQNATSRQALASDVESLIMSLVDVGNANYNGRYIFSGHKTDTEAFAAKEKEISAVASSEAGFDIYEKRTFADMAELPKGSYTVHMAFDADVLTFTLQDSTGRNLFIDSSGNDESASDGNRTTLSYTTKFEPGSVVNLGVGISVKMGDTVPPSGFATVEFNYTPGGDIQYQGDDGHINTTIGYNQNVDLNLTGEEVFMETSRILKGTRYNTINGLDITETTRFSQIDGANSIKSDGITVFGTDHNGFKLGIATLLSPDVAKLNMSTAGAAQRTIDIEYGERNYSITADQQSYESMEDLVFNLNRQLDAAGLANEINAHADGTKVMFATSKAGNTVSLGVTGSTNNHLGFPPQELTTSGKDTTFEFGYDGYDTTTLENTHAGISYGVDTDFYINDQLITLTAPADAAAVQTQMDAALQNLGLYHTINAAVTDNAGADFDISFKLVNTNYDNTTYLTTKAENADPYSDYQYSSPRTGDYPSGDEQNVGDYLNFIEVLYDNTVSATLDNGKVVIEDLRTGPSRISFAMNEQNTGIGFPKGGNPIHFEGRYTGSEDQFWKVNITNSAVAPGPGNELEFVITDSAGATLDTVTYDVTNYHGEQIELYQGVSVVMGDAALLTTDGATDVLSLDVKAENNLSFGDLNIVQDSENVNAFNTMNNLYNALMYNIDKAGVGAPSAWDDTSLNSTASPYNAGDFTGNYNDKWIYEVLPTGNTNSYYLQDALSAKSGTLDAIGGGVDLDFDYTVDINGTLNTFNLAGNYADWDAVAADMNIAIQGYAATLTGTDQVLAEQVQANVEDGVLVLSSHSGIVDVSMKPKDNVTMAQFGYLATADLAALGFLDDNEVVRSTETVTYDLTLKTAQERTLTFDYADAGVAVNPSIEITLPATNYTSAQLFADAVQAALNTEIGVIDGTNDRIDVGVQDNQLFFSVRDDGTVGGSVNPITNLHVSGDYEGTLGFFSKGDEATIKISAASGDVVNEIKLNTANKDGYVSDGVYMGFDSGTLFATDSYTTTVGSGIEYEIPLLDQAETQMTEALTRVGTNQNRADAVINFNSTLETSNEELKSIYLEATAYDQTKAITEYTAAQQAYEASLNVTAKIMQMSLLDYLR